MPDVVIIDQPVVGHTRRSLVLTDDRVGHYPEFRKFFVDRFKLDTVGLESPGYVKAPSGQIYVFVFVGRSGEPFPDGLEIYAVIEALEPLDEETVDQDLWAIMRWVVGGVGGPWNVADLDATGRLYQLPFLSKR
jgi:hypothetical protein